MITRREFSELFSLLSLSQQPSPALLLFTLIEVETKFRSQIQYRNCHHAAKSPKQTQAFAAQNFVMFAAGGFGFFARLALYSCTIFSSGPKTQLYNSPMLCSSCGSDSILNTLG
jgi:hypothetical protein